jgi:SAM-dependent methyltransferase
VTVDERHDGIEDTASPWHGEHVARYRHAVEAGVSGRVLDVASGSGYGSALLRRAGCQVVAVDPDEGATVKSLQAGPAVQARGERLPLRDDAFDSVVSIETIEHVPDPERFLDELRRVLRPGGLLVLTTPNAVYTKPVDGVPANPFHFREYRAEELVALVGDRFDQVEVLGQDLAGYVRVSPFEEDQRAAQGVRDRGRVLLWRALNKLPARASDRLSRRLWGHPLHLSDADYAFSRELVRDGRVLILHGRRP